jgi:hypothetical protein
VKRRAALVAAVTERRYMPPWKADPSNGPFVDQHPLSNEEIRLIRRWVDEGSVEGTPAPRAPARTWTEGWQLGHPDIVVTLPQAYTLPPDGTDAFRIFVIPIRPRPFDSSVARFRPKSKVVHHANIRIDKTPASRTRRGAAVRVAMVDRAPAQCPDGHFRLTPGHRRSAEGSLLASRRAPISRRTARPSGKPESVAPSDRLYFSDAAPTRTPAMCVWAGRALTSRGPARDHRLALCRSTWTCGGAAESALSRAMCGEAALPDGTVRPRSIKVRISVAASTGSPRRCISKGHDCRALHDNPPRAARRISRRNGRGGGSARRTRWAFLVTMVPKDASSCRPVSDSGPRFSPKT